MRSIKIPRVVLLLAGVAGLSGWTLALLVLSGRIGLLGPGTDWLAFYGAARAYLDGHLALIFDPEAFTAHLNSEFGWWLVEPLAFRPWVYPPGFLLLVLPFGMLPLAGSYVLFQVASGTALAGALAFKADRPDVRRLIIASAFLSFGAAANIMQGQNGFLTAAFLIGGWRATRSSPLLGGALLGMVTVKPQFWLLVPVALVALREWKALASCVGSAVVLAAVSAALFGIDAWLHWIDFARHPGVWIPNARIFGTSYFSLITAGIGLSGKLADAIQMTVTAASAVVVYLSCRATMPRDQQLAILLAAALIAAPHSSYYDTVLLAIAATLWIVDAAERGSALLRSEFALFVWTAPLFEAEVGRGFVPLLATAFIAVVLACRMRDAGARPELTRPAMAPGRERRAGRSG